MWTGICGSGAVTGALLAVNADYHGEALAGALEGQLEVESYQHRRPAHARGGGRRGET